MKTFTPSFSYLRKGFYRVAKHPDKDQYTILNINDEVVSLNGFPLNRADLHPDYMCDHLGEILYHGAATPNDYLKRRCKEFNDKIETGFMGASQRKHYRSEALRPTWGKILYGAAFGIAIGVGVGSAYFPEKVVSHEEKIISQFKSITEVTNGGKPWNLLE